jgi:hypothetical protein
VNKSTHVRLSKPGHDALSAYAMRRGITKAQAASSLVNEFIYGRERVPTAKQLPLLPASEAGQIYVLKAGRNYKIGKAKNAAQRIRCLRLPMKHKVVATFNVNNRHEAERRLHKKFSDKHVNGEWFRLTLADLSGITGDLKGLEG